MKMSFKEAYSWLNQPGIKVMMPVDPHTQSALQKVMEALEKQIAKPYITAREEGDNFYTYHCPCCDLELGDENWDGEPDKDWLPYCEQCGQKINWNRR